MSRTTDDKKDFEIKLRVNSDTKQYLSEMAGKRGLSVSEYVRGLIRKDMLEKRNGIRRKNFL